MPHGTGASAFGVLLILLRCLGSSFIEEKNYKYVIIIPQGKNPKSSRKSQGKDPMLNQAWKLRCLGEDLEAGKAVQGQSAGK